MALPSGTVTFLFTDIEGSAKLWEQHPERMRLALARHDNLLREAIESSGGVVFKTVGDAFHAAFSTAPDALAAALAAQRKLNHGEHEGKQGKQTEDNENLPGENVSASSPVLTVSPVVEIRVRMALHTGTAELRDGDYFGLPLNRISRLLAIGHGGQVLLSRATRDLLPADTPLRDQGSHRLRDLREPEHVFQLLAPDLPSEFPPLRSLSLYANNLPIQTTSFIGREQEMTQIKRLLETTRLLTLTGVGGTGKTRLALQVAANLLEDYPDGVWVVELASLSEGDLVPQSVAAALGVREEPSRSPIETVIAYLREKTLLLLLDNCEHLLEACTQLADTLLRSCPKMKLLATSRERLNVAGETVWRVPPLSLPRLGSLSAAEKEPTAAWAECDSVRLFVERARSYRSDFAINAQNGLAVAEICQRLDGIPLAIELATARVRGMPIEQVSSRLNDRFRLLTGGSRTALPRQQTLRAMIDWSYDLLTQPERALLCRLAVFQGGWTLEAAEAVCSDTGQRLEARGMNATLDKGAHARKEGAASTAPTQATSCMTLASIADSEVLDLLMSLVDKSLVVYQEESGRYRFLETIRQYARERLRECGEGSSMHSKHQDYFLALAEEAESQLNGPEQAMWFERLEQEHDNLRVAIGWCLDTADGAEAGMRLIGALPQFWRVHGHYAEGKRLCANVLARADARCCASARAKALLAAGCMDWLLGDYAMARPLIEESLAIFQELGEKAGRANALNQLGNLADDPAARRAYYEQSLALRRELNDTRGIAVSLHNLGTIAWREGDTAVARALLEEAWSIYRTVGDVWGAVLTFGSLLHYVSAGGDAARLNSLLEEGLTLRAEIKDKHTEAMLLQRLFDVAIDQGDLERAFTVLEEGLALSVEIQDKPTKAMMLERLSDLAVDQGDLERAFAAYEQGFALYQETGNKQGMASIAYTPGHVYMLRGEYAAARACYDHCTALWRAVGKAGGELNASLAALGQGDWNGTSAYLTEVIALYQADEYYNEGLLNVLDVFAGMAVKQGRRERAARLFGAIEGQEAALKIRHRWARPFEKRLLNELKDSLDRERYASVWQEGKAMTLEQAIAYALVESET